MTRPIVWAIGGSDSSGGAGIQADVRSIHGMGAHACTVVSALTAQSSRGVSGVWPAPLDVFQAQLHALRDDMPPAAVKIGMLATADHVRAVAQLAASLAVPIVLDPVLGASAGGSLLDQGGRKALLEELLPHVEVVTPNLDEAGALLGGRRMDTDEEIEAAARELGSLGPGTVIVKGGHGAGELARDCVLHEGRVFWLLSRRIDSANTHGTGCTFASSFASARAQRLSPLDAAVVAKMYVTAAIRSAYAAGSGAGPVSQGGWPVSQADLPWLVARPDLEQPSFPRMDRPMGLYAIVDSAEWVQRLAGSGVGSLQLRVKDLTGDPLRHAIATAIAIARKADIPLFINDYWELAVELGAWGVHLGQEDLETADVRAIADAGLRLGVSTHCYEEVARAHALGPSYIAIGPVYETKIKVMRFAPQGLDALQRWRITLPDYPLVAIGGIDASNAREVLAAGADSIAVIRAITHAADPLAATAELRAIVEAAERSRGR